MAIYRGPGGAGDATNDASSQAIIATQAAQEAEAAKVEAQAYAEQVKGVVEIKSNQFTGDGSTTSFVLSAAPANKTNVIVEVDGVVQQTSSYSVSGSTLTFTEAPYNGAAIETRIISNTGTLNSAQAENVSFYQTGSGAVTRDVQSKIRETVSVKDFGAVGDGITDDTAAIQAALNSGTIVEIPNGTYLTGKLDVRLNTHIIGKGRAVLKARTGTDNPKILSFSSSGFNYISGVYFDGNTSSSQDFSNIIAVYLSNWVIFDSCVWINCKGIAIVYSNSSYGGVRNSTFKDCGVYHLISGLEEDKKQAIAVTEVCDMPFANYNKFYNIGLDCISFANSNIYGASAIGNTIRTSHSGSIYVSTCSHTVVANNLITNGATGGNAIDCSNAKDIVISSNICVGNGAAGILVADCKNVTVTGNNCSNNWQSKTSVHKGGITLASNSPGSISNIALTNNTCYDTQGSNVTQINAIGLVTTNGGTYSDVNIDMSNNLFGYTSTGTLDKTAIFQTQVLGICGYPYAVNLNNLSETILYKAPNKYGEYNIIQTGSAAFGKFMATPGGVGQKLLDPDSAYSLTDTGTTQAVYYDSGTQTVRLKNRTGVTKTYLILPVNWSTL